MFIDSKPVMSLVFHLRPPNEILIKLNKHNSYNVRLLHLNQIWAPLGKLN